MNTHTENKQPPHLCLPLKRGSNGSPSPHLLHMHPQHPHTQYIQSTTSRDSPITKEKKPFTLGTKPHRSNTPLSHNLHLCVSLSNVTCTHTYSLPLVRHMHYKPGCCTLRRRLMTVLHPNSPGRGVTHGKKRDRVAKCDAAERAVGTAVSFDSKNFIRNL